MKNGPQILLMGILALSFSASDVFSASDSLKPINASSVSPASILPVAKPAGNLPVPPYMPGAGDPPTLEDTVLRISVNAQGEITDVFALKSSRSPRLDALAVEFVRSTWKFVSVLENGKAVPSRRIERISWPASRP